MSRLRPAQALLPCLSALLFAVSCDDSTATATKDRTPAALEIHYGTGQEGTVGAPLAEEVAVVVTNADGDPIGDVSVSFAIAAGGGSVAPASVKTSPAGVARSTWTLGTTAGSQRLAASAAGLDAIEFLATGRAAMPASLVIMDGDGQTAPVGTPVDVAPTVLVGDAYGNPVAGATVTFAVASGGGHIAGARATTDASGIAAAGAWTMGPEAGANSVVATVGDVEALSLTATAVAGAASSLELVQAPSASARSGTALATQPSLRVLDENGNPVATAGVVVTAVLGSGGGSLSGTTTATTNASGVATFTDLAISGLVGAKTLAFSSPRIFGATSQAIALAAGDPASIAVVAGDAQVATVATPVTVAPAVRVTDASGNPVAGTSVTFEVSGGAGLVAGPTVQTDADGVAAAGGWQLGTTAGANALTATVSGMTPATITATGTAGAPASLVKLAGDAQVQAAGQRVDVAPTVEVRDAYGNAVEGVAVGFRTSVVASLRDTLVVSGANGRAAAPSWHLGPRAGAYELTASADGLAPATFTATATGFTSASVVQAGSNHSCGLTESGEAFCWGYGHNGQLGDTTVMQTATPTAVAGGRIWSAIEAADNHTCALTIDGEAYCWGYNGNRELGVGSSDQWVLLPMRVLTDQRFTSLSTGVNHSCALTAAGEAYCWGHNGNGTLGDGTTLWRYQPVPVVGGVTFVQIAAAYNHTCGLAADGAVHCWGYDGNGELGDGTAGGNSLTPAPVSGGVTFTHIDADYHSSCGVATDGAAYCWGYNGNGQLGDGTTTPRSVPTAVSGGLTFSSITVGVNYACGVATNGDGYCWGHNGYGALGDGTTTPRLAPTAVTGGLAFASIDAGWQYTTCGVTTEAKAYCWGLSNYGQVGDGSWTSGGTNQVLAPSAVLP